MTHQPRFLIIVYEPGNFEWAHDIANHGHQTGAYDCLIWSPYALEERENYRARAISVGSAYIEETTPKGSLADLLTPLSGWLSAKPTRLPLKPKINTADIFDRNFLPHLLAADQMAVLRASDAVERRIRFCEDWLVRLGVDTIIFPEANVERDSHAWIQAAKRRGIHTTVISYGALSRNEAITAYRDSAAHAVEGYLRELVHDHLPHWIEQGDGYCITRLPVVQALARERCGCAPFDPWLVNAEDPDAIILESEELRDRYISFGFDPDRLFAIGHPAQDRLGASFARRDDLRFEILKHYSMPHNTNIVIVAMPPNQLASRPSPFSSYLELFCAFGLLPKRLKDALVLVSPHPNINLLGRESMRAEGLTVDVRSLPDLLAAADFYIACVSSTIKWALAAGLPIINFDCYGYNYSDYSGLGNVQCCTTLADFEAALANWSDQEKVMAVRLVAKQGATKWGRLDGGSLDRIVEFCLQRVTIPS